MSREEEISHSIRKTTISPDQFAIHRHIFSLELLEPVTLPAFKGDLLHRQFGRALNMVSPRFGRYFFRPEKPPGWPDPRQTPPRPFMLVPTATGKTKFTKGDTLDIQITLFGQAQLQLMTVFAALEKLGLECGLGSQGVGRFVIRKLQQITAHGTHELFTEDCWTGTPVPTSAADILQAVPASASSIEIQINTLLHLQHHGKLVRNHLALAVLMDRLLGRINTIAAMYCGGQLLSPEEKIALVTLARTAGIETDDTHLEEWPRDRVKQDKMLLTGLAGNVIYGNVPTVLLPWLSLGQWVGVGKKTTFGLGSYSMEITTCTN